MYAYSSMKWSGRRSHAGKVLNASYLAASVEADVGIGRKRRQDRSPSVDSSSSSSADEPEVKYIKLGTSESNARDYLKCVECFLMTTKMVVRTSF